MNEMNEMSESPDFNLLSARLPTARVAPLEITKRRLPTLKISKVPPQLQPQLTSSQTNANNAESNFNNRLSNQSANNSQLKSTSVDLLNVDIKNVIFKGKEFYFYLHNIHKLNSTVYILCEYSVM